MDPSLNKNVLKIINKMVEAKDFLRINVEKTDEGTLLIDTGIEAKGSYAAGKYVTEASMGGLGKAQINLMPYNDSYLPTITVTTNFPSLALLGAQLAGWKINIGQFYAIGSGPARALSLKPKEVYSKIDYEDKADTATLILEASLKPTKDVLEYIAKECKVSIDMLNIIVTPTSSITCATQISGRILETGLNKLYNLGLDPKLVISGIGCAPIAPIHPKVEKTMGRTNDMILYGGVAYFNVVYDNDSELKDIVEQAPSSKSGNYGEPFIKILKKANYDFYMTGSEFFAPAVIIVNNIRSGKSFTAGEINLNILKQSINS